MGWTDPTITQDVTKIKKVHIDELRDKVVNGDHGLDKYGKTLADVKTWADAHARYTGKGLFPSDNWTDPTLIQNATFIKNKHTYEVRAVTDYLHDINVESLPNWTDLTLTQDEIRIKRLHVTELRDEIGDEGQNLPAIISTDLLAFFESAAGAGWALQDGSGGELDLIDKFIKGAAAQGSETGSNTHGHSFSGSTPGINFTQSCAVAGITVRLSSTHYHSINHSHTAVNNIPAHYSLIPYRGIGALKKTGMIMFFYGGSTPSGWSTYSNLLNRFLKGGSSAGGPSGSDTHSHGSQGFTTGGYVGTSVAAPPAAHLPTQRDSSIVHTHTFNHGHSDSEDIKPVYKNLIPVKMNAGGKIEVGIIGIFRGSSVPDKWHLCDGNGGTPNLMGDYIRGNAASSGGGGSNSHGHSKTFDTSLWDANTSEMGGIDGVVGDHSHDANHSHGGVNHEPIHRPLMVCMFTG